MTSLFESSPHPGVSHILSRSTFGFTPSPKTSCLETRESYGRMRKYILAGYIVAIITMFTQVGVDRNLQGILLLMAIVNHRIYTILF